MSVFLSWIFSKICISISPHLIQEKTTSPIKVRQATTSLIISSAIYSAKFRSFFRRPLDLPYHIRYKCFSFRRIWFTFFYILLEILLFFNPQNHLFSLIFNFIDHSQTIVNPESISSKSRFISPYIIKSIKSSNYYRLKYLVISKSLCSHACPAFQIIICSIL